MPDWLSGNIAPTVSAASGSPSWQDQLFRLCAALVLGLCVAAIFRWSHGREHDRGTMLSGTLVLLSVLIAMVSMVIGDSVALAFSLAGALSIVRFRTVVEDTRDTAFVIFAVVVGMAAGAGHLRVALLGLPVAGLTAIAMSWPTASSSMTGTLSVKLGLSLDPRTAILPLLDELKTAHRLTSAATARQGSMMELKYSVTLTTPDQLTTLITRLNQIDGVQSAEFSTT